MAAPSFLAKATGDVAAAYSRKLLSMSSLKYHALMLVPIFLALMMAAGSQFLKFDNEPQDLWLQPDDWSLEARDFRHRMFEYAREENVVITAENEGDNLLTKDLLHEMFNIYEDIMAIEVTVQSPEGIVTVTTGDICLPSNISAIVPDMPKKAACLVNSILAYWDYSRIKLDEDKDIFKTVSNAHATDPKTQGPIFPDQVMGGVSYNDNGTQITKVEATKMWFYINYSYNITNGWPNYLGDVVEPWEAVFLKILQDYSPGLNVYRHSERSDGDEMEAAFNHDVPIIGAAIGVIVVLLLLYITFWPAKAPLRTCTRLTRASVAFFCIIATITTCMGVIGISKLPFNGVVWYMLTFVILYVTHHIAVITNAVNNEMPNRKNFEDVVTRILPPMSLTTVPFAFVYIFVAATPAVSLPGLSAACIAGGFGLVVGHLLVCTSYLCAAAASFRASPEGKVELESAGKEEASETTALLGEGPGEQSILVGALQKLFSSIIAKVAFVVAIVAIFSVGVYGGINFKQQATEASVYPASSYLHKFFVEEDRYFGTIGVPCDVVLGDIDYADPANGRRLVALAEDMLDSGLFQYVPIEHYSFYNGFLNFLVTKNYTAPGEFPPADKFYEWFAAYGKSFAELEFYIDVLPNVKTWEGKPIQNFTATRFQALSNNINDMKNQSHLAETLEAIAKKNTDGDFKPMMYAPPLYIFRQYGTVVEATKFMVMITSVACAIVALAIDWKSAGVALFVVASVTVSMFGVLMHYTGTSLDSTTIIQLSFVIPLTMDLIIHTMYAIRTTSSSSVGKAIQVQAGDSKDSFIESSRVAHSGFAAAKAFVHGPGAASLFCVCMATLLAFGMLLGLAVSPVVVIFAQTVLYSVGVGGICLVGVACILSGFT